MNMHVVASLASLTLRVSMKRGRAYETPLGCTASRRCNLTDAFLGEGGLPRPEDRSKLRGPHVGQGAVQTLIEKSGASAAALLASAFDHADRAAPRFRRLR